ncbi:hypothetical protein M758_1G160000 [Ceratodon purpureus]|nr:hypothetical protein M758_1G160000 [Ceratodon purpureus]
MRRNKHVPLSFNMQLQSTLLIGALFVTVITISTGSPPPTSHEPVGRKILSSRIGTEWMAEQEADRILALPDQPEVNFDMYGGYITVNKEAGRAHYYYFVEAEEDPQNKPLAFWFNGGPGCSSIAYGFAEELGPFFVNPGGKTLRLNHNAANKVANVVFVESPAGVGFSYSNTTDDLYVSGDNRTAHDNYAFVVNWMKRFPQYKGRPFYLTGESYAGVYVPQLAKLIFDNNKELSENNRINFKGFLLGNAMIDIPTFYQGNVEYTYHAGMISDEMYNKIKTVCNFNGITDPRLSGSCSELLWPAQGLYNNIGRVDLYSIHAPVCLLYDRQPDTAEFTPALGMLEYDPCTQAYSQIYFNRPDVQKAIHANTTGIPYPWTSCSAPLMANWTDMATTVLPIFQELLEAGLRLWMFSGDADSVVSTTSTRYALAKLNLTVEVPWYPWYNKLQVGGRGIGYKENLTFVTIRGAGHEVPLLRPEEFLQVFAAFLEDSLLPSHPYS